MNTDLLKSGIGPPGKRGEIYRKWLALISQTEKQEGKIHKAWSKASKQSADEVFQGFLTVYPWMHGYWIRYANIKFRTGDTEGARRVYQQAVEAVPALAQLWTAYLTFLVQTCPDADHVRSVFEAAIAAAGSDFYAHELWDAYASFEDQNGGSALQVYLQALTKPLHQFARIYSVICDAGIGPENLSVYESTQEKVAHAWKYERQLKRPFFHPKPLLPAERSAWFGYVDSLSGPERNAVYERLIVAGALDEAIWMRYLRWLLASRQDPEPLFKRAHSQLPREYTQVRLYYALWLEWKSRSDDAQKVYEAVAPLAAVEHSRFAARANDSSDPALILRTALPSLSGPDRVDVLKELFKLDKNAFQDHQSDDPEFWKAWLQTDPDNAESIYLQSPEGVLTEAYLELLARTDLEKYVQVDREVHRSALSSS